MKNLLVGFLLLISCPLSLGCVAGPYARQGATMGALIGAPVGAVIGSRNGEAGAGALIGGALGTLAGSNIGAGVDADQQALRQQAMQRQMPVMATGLGVHDIINMSQSGLGEDVIITQVRNQGIRQALSTNDLIAMKQAGVTDRVIQSLQSSPFPRPAGTGIPPQRSGPIIVEEHYWESPDCPPYFGPYPPRLHRPHRGPGRRASFSFSQRF